MSKVSDQHIKQRWHRIQLPCVVMYPTVDHYKIGQVNPEVLEFLNATVGKRYYRIFGWRVFFARKNDAALFKLTWR